MSAATTLQRQVLRVWCYAGGSGTAGMNFDYRILGPIEVWADGRPIDVGGARQRRLLAALVLAGGRPVAADRLVDAVWTGRPPSQARNTLRTYVARVRRALESSGTNPVVTEPSGWRLERNADDVDSARFESLLDAARAMSTDPLDALAAIEEALVLWRGDALEEFAHEEWCVGEATRLDGLRVFAQEEWIEAMLACGLHDDAIGELDLLIERHPVRDRPRAQLMLALYRAGRQVEAVRRFQDYRRYLDREIGVDVSDELRGLEQRIINRDLALRQLPTVRRRLRGYELGPQIGQGSFGRIYRASQPALGRQVAIKAIRPELADDSEFIRRFDAEAHLVARLEHPHIVPLYDYWREPGGAYLVMRYLRGGTAEQLLDAGGALALPRVMQIIEEVGDALATAHAAGVIHRDVKPANILFDERGSSYLGDFGIATRAGSDDVPVVDSRDAAIYASPEQLAHAEVAMSSDIYALGAVLFELLTGHAPFRRGTPLTELVDQKRSGRLPRLVDVRLDVPVGLDAVVQRAMAADPSDRFRDVGELVLATRTALMGTTGRSRLPHGLTVRNPYKGLAAFDEADSADFFGRDRLVAQLRDHLARSRFVVVAGPSGSGKSSVVRAGLTPQIRAAGAYVVTMIPGPRPVQAVTDALLRVAPQTQAAAARAALRQRPPRLVEAIARCLPDTSAEMTLIIDQFEELFTLSDDDEREAFLAALAAAVTDDDGRVRVIATLRADFYDRPLGHRAIGELTKANTVAVTPLGPTDLERAITGPATRVGVSVEPGLVASVIADGTGEATTLPLVQYLLTDLFEQRDGESLTVSAYERRGGLSGAVARRADEIFERYGRDGRDSSRRLFNRLVAPADGHDTRRRVRVSELPTSASGVIADYAAARLLTFDRDPTSREPTVEIAHEALISQWPRLHDWVEQNREGLAILRRLTQSAAEWDAAERDPSELYRGARLLGAEEWVADHDDELNETERAFIVASRCAREAERTAERRRERRRRQIVALFAVVAVVAVVAGLVAIRQRRIASDNAAEAERRALESQTGQLTSEARLAMAGADPDLAILLALAAHDLSSEISATPQPGVVAALHETVQASRLEQIIPGGFTEIAVSPNGQQVVLDHIVLDDSGGTNRLGLYDIATGDLIVERTVRSTIGGYAYSPDGSYLAVALDHGVDPHRDLPAMLLLDPQTLATVRELGGGGVTGPPSWSTDGRSVLAVGPAGAGVRVWSIDRTQVAQTLAGTGAIVSAEFVPDSNTIAIASNGSLDIVDRDGGGTLARHEIAETVIVLRVSPDGSTAALVDAGGFVRLIDVGTGRQQRTISTPSPQDVRFSPDGRRLSIAGNTDTVTVIDLDSGDETVLRGHGSGSWRHQYTPDGRRLLAVSRDGTTRVWNMDPEGPADLGNVAIGGTAWDATPVTSTSMLVTVQTDSTRAQVVLIDTADGTNRTIADFFYPSVWMRPVFSPDGSLTAGFDPDDHVARVIDVDTGDEVLSLRPCETPTAIDARHRWVLVKNVACPEPTERPPPGTARQGFVGLDTGELDVVVTGPDIADAALGPPGSVAADIVAYHFGNEVVFRDASSGDMMTAWPVPADVIPLSLAFSPDGSTLGLSAQTRQGILFAVDAIVDGTPASDAVTVFEDMSSGPTTRVVPLDEIIVTSGGGTQIRQWDLAGNLLVDVPTNPGTSAYMFALNDEETAYYQDAGGVLRRLTTNPDALAELARSRVQRGFTDAECERYLPLRSCPSL